MRSILEDQINLRQVAPNTYAVSWHADWALGATLIGGYVAAAVHRTAATHVVTEPALAAQNQPDILSLHYEFLRACEKCDSTITVTNLKVGADFSTFQLQLSQNGRTKVIALGTSTNFDKPVGPTVRVTSPLLPTPSPAPDFERISAHQPDPHWLPGRIVGEVLTFTHRMLVLNPRAGFPAQGICDAWNGFMEDERMDATYLAMMTDVIPSMSDTLLRNGGLYDAHVFLEKLRLWAEEHPGIPASVPNTQAEALQATTYNCTITLDLEFKRRVPPEGLRWIFTRTTTKVLQAGRMDVEITICDEDMEYLCLARQLILVAEAKRKFRSNAPASAL
ncbi:thioesterase family protein [Thozetella sp. PMI_491]|nr:thioesterase family protein [Thozetella sp. PMI_491]